MLPLREGPRPLRKPTEEETKGSYTRRKERCGLRTRTPSGSCRGREGKTKVGYGILCQRNPDSQSRRCLHSVLHLEHQLLLTTLSNLTSSGLEQAYKQPPDPTIPRGGFSIPLASLSFACFTHRVSNARTSPGPALDTGAQGH